MSVTREHKRGEVGWGYGKGRRDRKSVICSRSWKKTHGWRKWRGEGDVRKVRLETGQEPDHREYSKLWWLPGRWKWSCLHSITQDYPYWPHYVLQKTFLIIFVLIFCYVSQHCRGFPGGSEVKASASNAGDPGSIPELGRSPGEGNGNPLQYSCLENPMDGEAW